MLELARARREGFRAGIVAALGWGVAAVLAWLVLR